MRKFLIALVLLLGIYFVIGQFSEVQSIVETLRRGDLRFVLLAAIVQLLWLVNVAASYQAIYHALGMREDLKELLILAAAANFVNVVAPSVGMGGMAVFVTQARHRDYSPARAAIAGALYAFFDYTGFLMLLGLGIIVLVRRNNLTVTEITASIILLLIALALGTLLYLGMRSESAFERALVVLTRLTNRILRPFLRRDYLSESRAHAFAYDAAAGLQQIRHNPQNLLRPTLLALTNKVLLTMVLWMVFLSFHVPLSVGTLIAGSAISYLFFIVSPTPSGVGIVEGVLTLALRSMYVPLEAAAVIALAFRGFTFWMPLGIGMLAFRRLGNTSSPAS
ncbi:MAG: hypothetical protein Fur0018_03210 [Anaerolineales bacterium]